MKPTARILKVTEDHIEQFKDFKNQLPNEILLGMVVAEIGQILDELDKRITEIENQNIGSRCSG